MLLHPLLEFNHVGEVFYSPGRRRWSWCMLGVLSTCFIQGGLFCLFVSKYNQRVIRDSPEGRQTNYCRRSIDPLDEDLQLLVGILTVRKRPRAPCHLTSRAQQWAREPALMKLLWALRGVHGVTASGRGYLHSIFLGWILRSRITGWYGRCVFNLIETATSLPK